MFKYLIIFALLVAIAAAKPYVYASPYAAAYSAPVAAYTAPYAYTYPAYSAYSAYTYPAYSVASPYYI